VLLVGSVAAADVPELGEPETRDEVRRRLGEAGCELVYSPASERWLARLDGPVPELEGHHPVLALGTAELAVLATCWLHLRFLPGEGEAIGPVLVNDPRVAVIAFTGSKAVGLSILRIIEPGERRTRASA